MGKTTHSGYAFGAGKREGNGGGIRRRQVPLLAEHRTTAPATAPTLPTATPCATLRRRRYRPHAARGGSGATPPDCAGYWVRTNRRRGSKMGSGKMNRGTVALSTGTSRS